MIGPSMESAIRPRAEAEGTRGREEMQTGNSKLTMITFARTR